MASRQPTPQQLERVPWSVLGPEFHQHFEQGQHIAIIGPTGEGKTTFAVTLMDEFVAAGGSGVILANKPKDPTLTKLLSTGWRRIKTWPPDYEQRVGRRVVVWPDYGRASTAKRNRPIFEHALDGILSEGRWFVYIDETTYFIEQLGMRAVVDEYWNAARSSEVTMMAGAQRASWINRTMVTQESWLVAFKPRNLEDRDDIAKVAGDRAVREELTQLRRHEFMLIETATQARYISKIGT